MSGVGINSNETVPRPQGQINGPGQPQVHGQASVGLGNGSNNALPPTGGRSNNIATNNNNNNNNSTRSIPRPSQQQPNANRYGQYGSNGSNGAGRTPNGSGSGSGSGSSNNTSTNPRTFKPIPYTEEEQTKISGLLDKVLGPEYVSFRPGGGGQKVSYIEGWKALNLANEIFGFNGWSSELISTQVDFFDTHGNNGRFSMGLSVVVRITIRDGTYHEDFGYGYIENAKSKAMAFEKCKKEAFTDGLKRCLRCFGNVLGNCLYDRTIIPKIQKVKLPGAELEPKHFHRDPWVKERMAKDAPRSMDPPRPQSHQPPPPQSQPVSTRPPNNPQTPSAQSVRTNASMANSATSSNINGSHVQRPGSGGITSTSAQATVQTPRPPTHSTRTAPTTQSPSRPPQPPAPELDDFDDSFVFSDDIQMEEEDMSQNDGLDEYELQMLIHKNRENGGTDDPALTARSKYATASPSTNVQDEPPVNIPQSVSFVSAKAADLIQKNPIIDDPSKLPQFDPKFVSPNMRRTVDPTKSTPIKRSAVTAPRTRSATSATTTASSATTSSAMATSVSAPVGSASVGSTSVGSEDQTSSSTLALASASASTPTIGSTNMAAPNSVTAPVLGKRMLGLPPSQKQTYKRLHRDLSQVSQVSQASQGSDKENRPEPNAAE
ncbi:DNA repair and recombination protein Rad52p [[Candida] anglica]|uniref:DNA repair and recombination protein RAD52 n=1 Tax=[Candida] anglica TaxID=148631 RepID=A0ABP0EET5_9ASCO